MAAPGAPGYNPPMIWLFPAAIAVALASAAATGLLLAPLRRRAILDHPNHRSSHQTPTPRGGGLAVVPIVLAAWAAPLLIEPQGAYAALIAALAGAGGLAALSWIDDLRSLPAASRFAAQAVAVALGMAWLAGGAAPAFQGPVFQGLLPGWLDIAAAAIAWLWFINLFNFMDGIDGISGVEAASIGIGLSLLGLFAGHAPEAIWLPLSLAMAALGFLWFNWHPARIFLGDVGSVPFGYLLGWLLLQTAAAGHWAPALILPLYYLADATITLLRRAARREKVWQAHREHFYQRAVQNGRSHGRVSLAVLAANAVLAALALVAMAQPVVALAAAAAAVAALLAWMR
jgi:UDP-N-acetylmuramyl pentapeptide phosphotransferase/UDP-N-acetylglucosamine-1-phosphate transferase